MWGKPISRCELNLKLNLLLLPLFFSDRWIGKAASSWIESITGGRSARLRVNTSPVVCPVWNWKSEQSFTEQFVRLKRKRSEAVSERKHCFTGTHRWREAAGLFYIWTLSGSRAKDDLKKKKSSFTFEQYSLKEIKSQIPHISSKAIFICPHSRYWLEDAWSSDFRVGQRGGWRCTVITSWVGDIDQEAVSRDHWALSVLTDFVTRGKPKPDQIIHKEQNCRFPTNVQQSVSLEKSTWFKTNGLES